MEKAGAMMRVIQPKPFTFESGRRAVLLLHAFTGHSADVRMLGRYLQKKGYTTHAPIYSGHGQAPENILNTSPNDWFQDVKEAYRDLKELGYEEIAVAGLSLGGVLGLKLAYHVPIKGIATMATPMFFDNKEKLLIAFRSFAKQYKQLERKNKRTIDQEMKVLMERAPEMIRRLQPLIEEVKKNLKDVKEPALIIQPKRDQLININSAPYIYKHITSPEKDLLWYEKSTHVVTTDVEKNRLHEDVYNFLESLPWAV